MSSRLTTAELTYYYNAAASMYPELSVNLSWVPRRPLPAGTMTVSQSYLSRPRLAAGSALGDKYEIVGTDRTPVTASVLHYKHKFLLPEVEVQAARNQGIPYPMDDIRTSLNVLANQIQHVVLEESFAWDGVVVNGCRSGGTDGNNGTCDAAAWDTTTKPLVHAKSFVNTLETAGFERPFTWILSSNLITGLDDLNNAANPRSHRELAASQYGVTDIFPASIGTSTQARAYGFDAAATDDGVYIMCKPDPDNFCLYERWPTPLVTMNANLNKDLNAWEGWVEQRFTFLILQATSIQFNEDVDLA